ncbi:tetratricopeptide repeat protein [Fulvivirgaceae bacterium PWU4]|uniref:Tetratricopeptide repeat protein n=1 Tax=Chryseosolibacter histidini TaxID=2782349 RepID=A0AAP2DJ48_9BACT|nr:tetratricopeptide repeat protein [Chryseosolibacter histidini]MBT1697308.1 tetratricopeptide repeat protein [Chryseosolibacter histidini]
MDEDIYILIDRYLAGELSAEETQDFEGRISTDTAFAEKVLLYRSVTENLRSKFSGEEEEARLRARLAAIAQAELREEKQAKVVSLRWYHWAAAASILLIAVVWFYTGKSALPEYTEYASHGPLALAERGTDSLLQQAEEAFNTKQYTQAIRYLNQLLETDPDNRELQLYKGVALLETDRISEAEAIFSAIRNSDTAYKHKATWYLALSALKQKDYDKCRALLEQIPKESEDYAKAREILRRL